MTPFGMIVLATIFGLLIAKPILSLLQWMKSMQTVSSYAPEGHQVKQGTPTMGGLIPILVGLVATLLGWVPWQVAVLFFGFAAIGFMDDYLVPKFVKGSRGLSWMPKLALQFAVAGFVGLQLLSQDYALLALFIFVILFASNAYNFSDGLDGLAGGLGVLLFFGLFLYIMGPTSTVSVQAMSADLLIPMPTPGFLTATVIGGMLAFLYYNAPPAKVFMGDVGSLAIGALIGYGLFLFPSGVQVINPEGGATMGVLAAIVISGILIIELVPVPLQILSVKLRKGKRLFSYTPIHHAFEKKGVPETRVTASMLLTQLILILLAWQLVFGWVGLEGSRG